MGVIGVYLFGILFPLGNAHSLFASAFVANYCLTVGRYMHRAVTKIELNDDGKSVDLTCGRTHGYK